MLAYTLKDELKTQRSTLYFIIMSYITMGIYSVVWDMRFLQVFHKKYQLDESILKSLMLRLVTLTSIYYLIFGIIINFYIDPLYYFTANTFSHEYVLFLTAFFIAIVILNLVLAISFTLQIRKILILFFKQHAIHRKVNLLWSLLFDSYYFYYVIRDFALEDEPIDIKYIPQGEEMTK